ncbi:MAG TPA: creatininase family protein [Xanthobacteraceae bacterium]|jgi:creatinine amidohydrolase|nr:creatininase family protein [Xanthobacteraceae bacterium]
MPLKRDWAEMTWEDFADADPSWVAVLPLAAVEQHGPHLPLGTDAFIVEAYLARARKLLPDAPKATFLPSHAIGTSHEHRAFAGTLTLAPETLVHGLAEIGESVHRAGVRKLVFANGHGGNVAALDLVALDLRARLGMLAVPCSFARFGYPDGLFAPQEIAHGIHGGDVETSIMLAARPDLVRTDLAKNFVPASAAMAREFKRLRAGEPVGFGWMSQDLNPSGAIGDATLATAAKGEAALAHGARAFAELLEDVARFDLARLGKGPLE